MAKFTFVVALSIAFVLFGCVGWASEGHSSPIQLANAQLAHSLTGPSDPYADGIPEEAVGTILKRSVGIVVGTSDVLDFKLLFPNNPPMTVIINDVGPHISIFQKNGKPLDSSRTADDNLFLLRASDVFPEGSRWSALDTPNAYVNGTVNNTNNTVPSRPSTPGVSVDFQRFWRSVSPAITSFNFTLGCDGRDYSGEITVRIHPYTFVAPSMTYRSVAMGGSSSASSSRLSALLNSGGRQISLSVFNPIERKRVDLTSSNQLATVTITSLPTNGCQLYQMTNGLTLITAIGTNITDKNLNVVIAPSNSMSVGSSCEFSYIAVTRRGFASNNGTITLSVTAAEKPIVYNTNVYFRAYEDTTRPVDFFVNSINPPSNYTWVIIAGPKYGELYDVEESAFTQLTKPLPIKPNEPYSAYTGPENRLVLFYKLNAVGQKHFADLKKRQEAAMSAAAALENQGRMVGRGRGGSVSEPRQQWNPTVKSPDNKKGFTPRILTKEPLMTAPDIKAKPSAREFAAAAATVTTQPASPAPPNVAISDTIVFQVKDAYESSFPAMVRINFITASSPTCGVSNFPHTFWDKPLNNLLLNYTVPSGRRAQRIILTGVPKNPLGDLYYRRSYATEPEDDQYEEDITLDENEEEVDTIVRITKALRQGDVFGDRNRRLSFMVRPNNRNRTGEDVYTFRVVTDTTGSLSCTGTLKFTVVPHDEKQTVGAGAKKAVLNVRNEIARLNSIDLMPFWGLANRSLLEKNQNDKSKIVKVRITKAPVLGKIFALSPTTPYQPNEMVRGHVGIMAFCGTNPCDQYLDSELKVGSEASALELWSQASYDTLDGALFYFYKSPYQEMISVDYKAVSDTFEYVFVDQQGRESDPQAVKVWFRKPRRRIVTVEYPMSAVKRWDTYNHQQETIIPIQVADPTRFAVQILDPDPYRRHGERVPFRVFQHRIDGNRVVPGIRLAPSVRSGLQGNWVANTNNSVVLIPTIESRVQVFKFRARLYPRNPEAHKTGDISNDVSSVTNYEEVRVVVRRSGNTVPVWDDTNIVKYNVFVDERIRLMLTATDAEDDLVSFIITEAPKYGTLESETLRFGVSTLKILKSGARVVIPKGSSLRSELSLLYSSRGSSTWTYPVRDKFVVHADDGGGTLSMPITVTIDIIGDTQERNSQPLQFVVRTGNITVYVVVLVIVLLGAASFFLRRRYYAGAAARGYGGVPTAAAVGETEMS